MTADSRLIIPLDLPTTDEARAMVERLGDAVSFYKIGLELLASDGMALAHELKASGKSIFLDWKLHDIGATVERSARVLATSGCDLLTVHAEPQVMKAAVKARGDSDLKILAVTVLTSLTDADLVDMGYSFNARDLVERRVRQAVECGVDGIVSSPHEAALAREIANEASRPDFLIVTPGVRPDWSAKNDQARAATPADALRAGASHLVCGRPITAANDPREAALKVVAEMAGA
ncbi:orotidine-5'-phosphate decarboxylase [Caulobacter sp. RHG1]|uniref:orotidine-5'-phosphate decarboxylase n=1 Tax=Caulobacter sp. (strain RHG1) TaxID=2545762 RepID=UPI0015552A81|nr:orotidine-5'-phosphate decarboxylase [Caulobacter sp. RHG1]NQE62091.1 Orotidine 5'-phosphate decarboxylase [Caulobacter sp. RHG1]